MFFSTRFFSDEETRRFPGILSQPCDMEYMWSSARAPQLSRAQVKKLARPEKKTSCLLAGLSAAAAHPPRARGWRSLEESLQS
jgi:hypothetical protein